MLAHQRSEPLVQPLSNTRQLALASLTTVEQNEVMMSKRSRNKLTQLANPSIAASFGDGERVSKFEKFRPAAKHAGSELSPAVGVPAKAEPGLDLRILSPLYCYLRGRATERGFGSCKLAQLGLSSGLVIRRESSYRSRVCSCGCMEVGEREMR